MEFGPLTQRFGKNSDLKVCRGDETSDLIFESRVRSGLGFRDSSFEFNSIIFNFFKNPGSGYGSNLLCWVKKFGFWFRVHKLLNVGYFFKGSRPVMSSEDFFTLKKGY